MNRQTIQPGSGKLRRPCGWTCGAWLGVGLLFLAHCPCLRSQASPPKRQIARPPAAAARVAAMPLDFTLASDSYVELDGMTNIGFPWYSRSNHVRSAVVLAADRSRLKTLFNQIQAAAAHSNRAGIPTPQLDLPLRRPPLGNLFVPVLSLRGDSAGMNHAMHAALQARRHPMIQYVFVKLQKVQVRRTPPGGPPALQLRVIGKLAMAGKERTLSANMFIWRDAHGHFHVYARHAVRMSDFGITPPRAFFGLFRARDRVFVIFNLDFVLARHSPTRKARP